MTEETLPVQQAQDMVDLTEYVAMQELERHRWYTRRLVVYNSPSGYLRGFVYLDPASELQEDQDRFEADPVPTFPVHSATMTKIVYVRDV
jgi:hypothetical protein